MKHCILIIGLILFLRKVSNGQDSNDFFFEEFQISLNRSNVKDINAEDRNGFGLGAYHSFLPDKKINLVLGLEYNRISQFKKRMYEWINRSKVCHSNRSICATQTGVFVPLIPDQRVPQNEVKA